MKKTVEVAVQVCDLCDRSSQCLWTCQVCGQEFCICCDGHAHGAVVPVKCCKECVCDPNVAAEIEWAAAGIREIVDKRNGNLAALRRRAAPVETFDANV